MEKLISRVVAYDQTQANSNFRIIKHSLVQPYNVRLNVAIINSTTRSQNNTVALLQFCIVDGPHMTHESQMITWDFKQSRESWSEIGDENTMSIVSFVSVTLSLTRLSNMLIAQTSLARALWLSITTLQFVTYATLRSCERRMRALRWWWWHALGCGHGRPGETRAR